MSNVIPEKQAQALIDEVEKLTDTQKLGTYHDELAYYAKSIVHLHRRVAELTHHQDEERRLRNLLWDYGLAHDRDSAERAFCSAALYADLKVWDPPEPDHFFGFEFVQLDTLDFEVWMCRYCNHLVTYRAQHRETCNA